jgi:hypothetical protein
MVPSQINKEIVFNEAILKLDGFCNASIKGFTDTIPSSGATGDKYILKTGEHQNYICYFFAETSGWQLLSPKQGMIFFCEQLKQFIYFDGQDWLPQSEAVKENSDKLISVNETFEVDENSSHLCLYLNTDSIINVSKVKTNSLRLIIKQNYQEAYQIGWEGQILWPNKIPHQITQAPNSFDVIELYKLHEEDRFIAQIIGTNYQY